MNARSPSKYPSETDTICHIFSGSRPAAIYAQESGRIKGGLTFYPSKAATFFAHAACFSAEIAAMHPKFLPAGRAAFPSRV
ncbi:hypothetical protein [Sphingomonas trueperi]|uniref:hypothetical protein n=1 Tax=Sphingomonas trueperi TaxID=53317 RepID=UPI000F2185F8